MRNLKRALSLLLSSTMVLGMLVMGGSAAGYKDVDASNDHQEAIEVLQAVGIMTGDENGNFNPDGSITRNEMAVIMAHLLNLDYDYYRGTNPFTDVPEWAAPYVAACAAEGVVAGIGNGQYGGDQKVTAAQASLMIMKALGYFQNAEDFGTDWQVATIRQASYINLFDNINANAESALTRAQVAQLVLNGLLSDMVDFTGDKGIQIGDVTVGYKAEYTSRTSSDKKYNTLVSGKTDIANQGQYYIQLGEELYNGKLQMNDDATDDFQRPATTWVYDKKEIGTYVDWDLMVEEYTTAITGKDLYNLLTKSVIEDNYVSYYVDGKTDAGIKAENMVKTNTTKYATTGNGVLTQVFVDTDAEEITITSINTYLAKATADYDSKKESLSVNMWAPAAKKDASVTLDEVAGIDGYKKDDVVMVNVAYDGTNYQIVNVMDPEVISDAKVTKYSENSYMVTDGTQYDYAFSGKLTESLNVIAGYGNNALTNYTYILYLDQYGYIIGNDKFEGEENYLFIAGYDYSISNLANKTATASAIFLDGTMKNIEVNVEDTDAAIASYNAGNGSGTDYTVDFSNTAGEEQYNKWFTYTEDDGVYTLAPADNWMDVKYNADGKINSYSVRLNQTTGSGISTRAYGNDDSVFITAEAGTVSADSKKAITKVTATYTGAQNVDLSVLDKNSTGLGADKASVYAVYDNNQYIIGAIVLGEDTTSSKNYAYVLKDAKNEYVDADDNYYWDFEAVVDGHIETLTIKASASKFATLQATIQAQLATNAPTANNGLMKLTYDADGYVVGAEVMDDSIDYIFSNSEFAAQTEMDPADFSAYTLQYKLANTLTVVGRTLYTSNAKDQGLTLEEGAPVIVVQTETYTGGEPAKVVYEEYSSIDQALEALNNKNAFKGWISAVLNEKGTAKYIVLNSADAVSITTDGGDSKDPTTSVTAVTASYSAGSITVNLTGAASTDKNTVTVSLVNGGALVPITSAEITGTTGTIAATLTTGIYQVACGNVTYVLGVA